MNYEEKEDTTVYKVVVNHEEQYSIWPADKENALGWGDVGKTGTKPECLAYIKRSMDRYEVTEPEEGNGGGGKS